MTQRYILDNNKNPIPCPDIVEWLGWMEDPDNSRIAEQTIGELRVSTVFLGTGYARLGGKPALFETMVFSLRANASVVLDTEKAEFNPDDYRPNALHATRYESYAQAVEGHERMVAMCQPNQLQ